MKHRLADEADRRVDLVLACGDGIAAAADDDAQVVDVCVVRRVRDARGGTGVGGLPGGRAEQQERRAFLLLALEASWPIGEAPISEEQGLGRKEDYMYALAKPHGPCRGSGGSDMHKQIKNQNQNRNIKHPAA